MYSSTVHCTVPDKGSELLYIPSQLLEVEVQRPTVQNTNTVLKKVYKVSKKTWRKVGEKVLKQSIKKDVETKFTDFESKLEANL